MNTYVARQPILDGDGTIFGYELLFRAGAANIFGTEDFEHATASVIDDCVSVWGLDALAPTGRAFVNFGRHALLREGHRVLPRDRVVIELLENVALDAEVLAACRQLRDDGYTLALDDFIYTPDKAAVLELADIVKVDFLATTGADRVELAQRLRSQAVRMLAEKVESQEEFANARELGFTLFQGYYFCRPEMLSRQEASVSKINYLRLTSEVNQPDVDLERLEQIIKHDVALSLKLLRYLNSAGFAMRSKVTSIRQALALLGERPFKRWATVMALRMLGSDKSPELITQALLRARFCELLSTHVGLRGGEVELFLVGLLSTVDALLDRPMSDIVGELPLAPELRDVLLGKPTARGTLFRLALAWERGDWAEVQVHAAEAGLGDHDLSVDYRQALQWVEQFTKAAV
jgi:c-di-GMP-related signal transduction protein